MKCMIVLFALTAVALAEPQWGGHWGAAPAAPSAPVQDTPEVAAAKAAHFAAVAQAQSNPANQNWNQAHGQQHQGNWNQGNTWNAPPAQHQAPYNGPLALPPGFDRNGAPLPVQDTPEVAAEKAHQLSLLSRAGGNVPAGQAPAWNPAPAQSWNAAPAQSWNSAPAQSWNAAPAHSWNSAPAQSWNAAPVHGANQALPADTPEVAAAKAAHFAAVAQVQQGHSGRRWRRSAVLPVLAYGRTYTNFPGSTAPLAAPVVAAPVVAAPVVAAPIVRSFGYASHYPTVYGSHWW